MQPRHRPVRDQLNVQYSCADFGDRRLDVGGFAALDRHLGAARREFLSHGEADTFCRTRDQSTLKWAEGGSYARGKRLFQI